MKNEFRIISKLKFAYDVEDSIILYFDDESGDGKFKMRIDKKHQNDYLLNHEGKKFIVKGHMRTTICNDVKLIIDDIIFYDGI